MNVDLLKRVQEEILDTPERFCAAHWAFARNASEVIERDEAPEGFKCCIAGQVLLLSGRSDERGLLCRSGLHNNDGSLYRRAAEALGLTAAQRNELFFPSQWDKPYKQEYYLCSRDEEAAVCAAYIDYFMEKHASPAAASEAVQDTTERQQRPSRQPARTPVAVPA